MRVLALNAGSNSLKFELVDTPAEASTGRDPAPPDENEAALLSEPKIPFGRPSADLGAGRESVVRASSLQDIGFGAIALAGTYDNLGQDNAQFSLLDGKRPTHTEKLAVRDHGHATELLFAWLEKNQHLARVERIAHRIVHGADLFSGPARLSDEVIRQIESLSELAPLHNQSALEVIAAARARLHDRLPMLAVFDTVFHQTLPDPAALYPLPLDFAAQHKIRRYGFHGISHRYLMLRYAELSGRALEETKLITLHLEGGSSACAIANGRSVDTSMGFTPLEGLMMGTRSGDLDPALALYLARQFTHDPNQAETFLNKKCGLLGVSGRSSDTRDLIHHLDDPYVTLALDMFAYRVRKYIGAYLAALGGAHAIVFGGGIGENMPLIRRKIIQGFDWCGLSLDPSRNQSVVDREGPISQPGASIPIWVIPTQEGVMMARDAAALDTSV